MPKKKSPPITEAWRGLTFTRRALVVGGAQAAVGVALAARMAYISVVDNDRYVLESESNRVNLTLIPPRRGWIVDRNGKALANNRVSLRIDIIPDRLHNKEIVLGQLQTLLRLDGDTMERINRDLKAASGFQPVAIKEDMTEAEYSSILVRLPELPGIAPQRGFARNYPTGAAVGHLIGYVGAPNAEEYQKVKDPLYITPGYKIGKDGLEKYFQDMLKGQPGARRVEVTARGKVVRDLSTQADVQGKTVHLTIDADLQEFVARRMGRESGAAVVIDCHNGDILSFVSMPSFDPNSFSDGISSSEYAWLRADDHQPLINKATRGLYPPGSTLKPMAAIAAIEHGIDPSERHTCIGGYRLGSRFFRCLGRHGSVDMATAIMKSCNSYFYWVAHRLGYDAIAPTAKLMGLGEEFQLAGSNQRFGTIPDSAWKMKKYDQPWSASDSLNAVIGQGYVSVNPLQLAVMAARIASGRRLYPRLVNRHFKNEALPFSAEALATARHGMDLVVNGPGGTAGRSKLPLDGIAMAGKTGTAQVRGLNTGNGKAGTWKFRDHGLFIGFAPVDNPRYATAVVIEHGMGGSRAAAPVAKDFMTFLFDREKAMEALETFEAGWGGTIKERMDRDYAAWKAGASKPDPELAQ
ncbi:penicillin-binding protein 2 [Sphingopyxis sp. USTB-05]|jgi:penicillin-binding protein 2|uniref:penicillin-binding protein 2 n=1 Tax=Sphingopyxis sp. USTB-05 TaxID=2830667 RepID=UPI00207914B2|nr:penicillin-binding protein 2 [Sphingopyxis sp. USTB-05]USI78549.1 penicillin-binding protein 2 [Sphingopyxis sp. USTB-05]